MTKILHDLPPKEQLAKRGVVSEDVDLGGLVKRYRVVDQTIFDAMFLREMIEQSCHEASHMFISDLVESGAIISSSSSEPGVRVPASVVANAMAERRMAFSAAYRRVESDCGEADASYLMGICGDCHTYPKSLKKLVQTAIRVGGALDSLSRFYGVSDRRDPRGIVRRQVGFSKKKKA